MEIASASALTSVSEPLVRIEHFRMDFAGTTVIEDLSFDVNRGGDVRVPGFERFG